MNPSKMKMWDCEMTERIYHQWTVAARTKKQAIRMALEGFPAINARANPTSLPSRRRHETPTNKAERGRRAERAHR